AGREKGTALGPRRVALDEPTGGDLEEDEEAHEAHEKDRQAAGAQEESAFGAAGGDEERGDGAALQGAGRRKEDVLRPGVRGQGDEGQEQRGARVDDDEANLARQVRVLE